MTSPVAIDTLAVSLADLNSNGTASVACEKGRVQVLFWQEAVGFADGGGGWSKMTVMLALALFTPNGQTTVQDVLVVSQSTSSAVGPVMSSTLIPADGAQRQANESDEKPSAISQGGWCYLR